MSTKLKINPQIIDHRDDDEKYRSWDSHRNATGINRFIRSQTPPIGSHNFRQKFLYYMKLSPQILQSSPRVCWPLWHIHISNDNRSFLFYVDLFLSFITDNIVIGLDCIYEWYCWPYLSTWGGSPHYLPSCWWVRVAHLCSLFLTCSPMLYVYHEFAPCLK